MVKIRFGIRVGLIPWDGGSRKYKNNTTLLLSLWNISFIPMLYQNQHPASDLVLIRLAYIVQTHPNDNESYFLL
jgi:hypothetical protein